MVEGILHIWSRIMMMMMRRGSRGDTEACYGNPGAPHGWHSGWATQETLAGLPVKSHFSLPMADRHGLSPQHRTCQQECLQMEGRTNSYTIIIIHLLYTIIITIIVFIIIWTWGCVVCTWAVFVRLEVSDRRTSSHGDQLSPQLHWLLKHQKDSQSLERAAAGMPDWKQKIY